MEPEIKIEEIVNVYDLPVDVNLRTKEKVTENGGI